MGIVCDSAESARSLRNFTDKVLSGVSSGQLYTVSETLMGELTNDIAVLGVLTLENVIERILQMDIKDEKDVDKMKIATTNSGKRADNGKLSVSN